MYDNIKSKMDKEMASVLWDLSQCNNVYRLLHIIDKLQSELEILHIECKDLVRDIESEKI